MRFRSVFVAVVFLFPFFPHVTAHFEGPNPAFGCPIEQDALRNLSPPKQLWLLDLCLTVVSLRFLIIIFASKRASDIGATWRTNNGRDDWYLST